MLDIDGSYGEGGGQIVRTAVALSAITGKGVRVFNIRAGRARPGLQPQHRMAVLSAAEICAAEVRGAEAGSVQFLFTPRTPPQSSAYEFNIGTAGAAGLVFQTLFLPLTIYGSQARFVIRGGTHVPHAPPLDYISSVYLKALQYAGISSRVTYGPAGFYPEGGGVVLGSAGAGSLNPINIGERGKLKNLTAHIVTSRLPSHVGERGTKTVAAVMKGIGRKVNIELHDSGDLARSTGAAVVLAAQCDSGFAGFTSLGERGRPMEKVAEQACDEFLEWWKSGATVDEHLADQLVLPMSLAAGESRWTTPVITEHLRTVLWVVERFLPITHQVAEADSGIFEVTLNGVEWKDYTEY